MQTAPIPANEAERLKAVQSLNILDTAPEKGFDDLTLEATQKLQVPIAAVSIIDAGREWFKSCQGLDTREGARATSFCGHAMLADNVFIVEDTLKDPRFVDNPQVIGQPFIRFYAGISLRDPKTSLPVGVFCVKDTKPREFGNADIATLIDLANRAQAELAKRVT